MNIVRFNWHLYIIALFALLMLFLFRTLGPKFNEVWIDLAMLLLVVPMVISLAVSWYIYDYSELYQLNWIKERSIAGSHILNVNAGFDETSSVLQQIFPNSKVNALDFYDPELHTEVSIKRARKDYQPYPDTITVNTDTKTLPFPDKSAAMINAFLSVHEIRDNDERAQFFKELNRILKDDGVIFVTEHLRDISNFLAYNIGFVHFLSHSTWLKTFSSAGLQVVSRQKVTPFITTFTLQKNGVTL